MHDGRTEMYVTPILVGTALQQLLEMPPRDPPFQSRYSHDLSATYLNGLRNQRPARPTGSRPAPFSSRTYSSLASQSSLTRSDSAPGVLSHQEDAEVEETDALATVQKSTSFSSSWKGRPLAQPPSSEPPTVRGRKVSPTAAIQVPEPSADGVYVESEARKLEKEEAQSLRAALERIDQKDEMRIYEAAKDEAANLVWKHQHPKAAEEELVAPYRNPDLKSKEKSRSSGQRQVSGTRKVSFPSEESKIYEEPQQIKEQQRSTVQPPTSELPLRARSRNKLPWLKTKSELPGTVPRLPEGKKSNQFEVQKTPPRQSRDADYTANTPRRPSVIDTIDEVDTPSLRGSLEIRSDDIRAATSMKRKDRSPNLPTPTAVSDQLGRPIVSFNRTWKPPSDSPRSSQDLDRPVIKLTESPSFVKSASRPLPRPSPANPEISVSAPSVPTINLPDEKPPSQPLPEMTLSAPAIPTINLADEPASSRPAPALPTINIPDNNPDVPVINVQARVGDSQLRPPRPLPVHSLSAPPGAVVKTPVTRLPWLNSRQSMPTVSCSSCALPISGRIVTASGANSQRDLKARFHPQCFTCNHCDTALECVSFYPEPDASRLERLGIAAETRDQPLSAEDNLLLQNDPLRFFCHLDFHEFFSPRCRSCKTPIEGEIVVACGDSYHVDHFFCAECGDPFSSSTPFVEGSDGYAYCVRCHTKKTSARCKGCKAQILDELSVEALGGKWHETCFVCLECGGGFGDEGRFFIREVDVEATEKEKRRGIMRKVEERAVCGACEEMRLKA